MINNPSSQTASYAMAVGFSNCSNNEISLTVARLAVLVLAAGNRRYAAFVNNSDQDITLCFAVRENARINHGIILKPFGGSYEINQNNLYQGPVSAISAGKCSLSIVECLE